MLPQSTATPNTENGASEEREADFSSYEVYRLAVSVVILFGHFGSNSLDGLVGISAASAGSRKNKGRETAVLDFSDPFFVLEALNAFVERRRLL